MTPTEEANVRLAREHFAAESAHDSERTLATLADDITYRVVPRARQPPARDAAGLSHPATLTVPSARDPRTAPRRCSH